MYALKADNSVLYVFTQRMITNLESETSKRKAADNNYFEVEIMKALVLALLSGLEDLEKKRLSHRNIKPPNILLNTESGF